MEKKWKVALDKKAMTGQELDEIKAISAAEDYQSTIDTMMEVVRGNGEILKAELEWTYNRIRPMETFWGNGLDIIVEAYVLRDGDIHYIMADFVQINGVCSREDWNELGYHRVYHHEVRI